MPPPRPDALPGAHLPPARMFRRPWHTTRLVLGSLLAIALVSLAIVALNLLADVGDPDRALGPAVVEQPSPTFSPPAASPTPTPTPTPLPTSPAATEEPPSASPPPTAAEFVRPPLWVLNSTRRSGLAARAAAEFRSAGWPIAGTGNYRRTLPATTVYFEPGQAEAARRLMAEFPQIERMAPRPGGMPGSGLTVVLTRDYPA